jgi:2-polyprenyl-3-methyl-5-hydroxy-6-metoxy-1,4-benzoquinol methylase
MTSFARRSYQKEFIDDLNCDGEELRQTLRELKTINKLLGGNHVTTNGIDKLLKKSPTQKVTIADIGCGGGDMIRVMHDWSQKTKLNISFIGIDANPNTIAMAADNLLKLPNVHFEAADVFDPAFQQQQVDIVTCTLFTHHFTDEELIRMFRSFKNKARIGMVINDLHRHPLAFYSIKILTRLFSRSRLVINDAPISVQRGFKKKELEEILLAAGWENYRISWHWAFRWQVVGFKWNSI